MKLRLSLCARGLPSDGASVKAKISPPEGSDDSIELGETAVVAGSDPDWTEMFTFDYEEGTSRRISLDVRDDNGVRLSSRSFLVEEILGKKGHVEAKKLSSGGVLIGHLGTAGGTGSLKLKLSGEKLKNLDGGLGLIRKSDPFFALMRLNEATGNWDSAHKSETVKNDLSPEWEETEVDLMKLCDGDLDMRLRIVIFDEDKKKNTQEVMGYLETSVTKFLEAKESDLAFSVMNKGEASGTINILQAELVGYKDPREGVAKAMEVASKTEVARMEAEEAEKELEKAEKDVEDAKKKLEKAEAAVEGARERAEAAKAAYSDVESLFDELDLGA